MRKPAITLLALLFGALTVAPSARVLPQSPEASLRYVPGQLLVKLKPNVDDTGDLPEFVAHAQGRVEPLMRSSRGGDLLLINLEGESVEDAAARLRRDARVEFAEPNYLWHAAAVPNDALFNQQYALMNTGSFLTGKPGADINATQAWDITTGSDDLVVAVIDTGVDLSHPDLAPNAWANPREVPNNGVDDDGNGYVDDVHGWNYLSNSPKVYDDPDDDWHGTHVTGAIGAAGNNEIGVAGVAWRVKLMVLKFLGTQSGSTADAVKAIDYAIDQKRRGQNVRVINASWAGEGESQSLKSAIINAGDNGILFVCAAGNGPINDDGRDVDSSPVYPAAWSADVPTIIAVASVNNTDSYAPFSNYGLTRVQVAAPGVFTISTTPNDGYGYGQGTSMSSPLVTGVAALLFSHEPNLSPAEARRRIVQTATPQPTLAGRVTSAGRVNAFNALTNTVPHAPSRPVIGTVTVTKKVVVVDGIGFGAGGAVIEVNGVALTKSRVNTDVALADGSAAELLAKLGKPGVNQTFPPGVAVTVTVYNPATGERSEPFTYSRR
ncbi:MAG TPA: S8 family peptidase [Blastocatellia bacterium]|nr:S8 family peptidase [Blastocatellia bacterium]